MFIRTTGKQITSRQLRLRILLLGLLHSSRSSNSLLGHGVEKRTQAETHQTKERRKHLLGHKQVCKGQQYGVQRAHSLCHGNQPSAHCTADLVGCLGAGDDGHGSEIDCVLDREELQNQSLWDMRQQSGQLRTKITVMSCWSRILPGSCFWTMVLRKCVSGAATQAP